MSGVDIFAWFVFVVILLSVVAGFVVLAQLPGKFAVERAHPQADAIIMASWLGLIFTGGIVWILAMIWSRTQPISGPEIASKSEVSALKARISELESLLASSGIDAS